jgi:DNA-binding CsgD family transcriptional regulator
VNVLRLRLAGKELSEPELLVLSAAARGFSAEETADLLIKSRHTVIAQRRSLQAKLEAKNLAHAVALAYERGLLPPAPDLERLVSGSGGEADPDGFEDDADAPSYHERL